MRIALSALLLVSLVALAPVAAAQADGPVTRYVRTRHDDVMRIIRRSASTDAERTARSRDVTRILSDLLDYEELSHRALRDHWEGLTAEQRTEFVSLLRQLVERQYESNLERIVDFEVAYTSETSSDAGVVVSTSARSRTERRQPPVEIVYTLHRQGSDWRVYDVTTEGSSMVETYRRQFNRVIRSDGWDGLLTRMRDRLADGTQTAAAATPRTGG